jgi:uncharacterized phage protein (TIGR01671 family)
MRKIKFRGRIEKNIWKYGIYEEKYCTALGYLKVISVQDKDRPMLSTAYIIEDETLGQFTGLYDKNGKEIYEGDIVKDNDITLVIQWDNNNSRYEAIRPFKSLPKNYELTLSFCEVIGNIYDNKELLEQ